jgi:glycosyltransferase involved in cell wall biosynthesis
MNPDPESKSMVEEPFISILTPVYNGARFLAECIESVLAQSYTNWEYIIVNNCSTDRTLMLAEEYARRDGRIRIVTNETFVNCEENHNNAFRQISGRSGYCKVVSADDRLLPHCIETMVRFVVQNPSVGIVGSYQQRGDRVIWQGLPERITVLSGRDACRMHLLHGVYVLGNPTNVLYRSDLIRSTQSFFPHSEPHADASACYESLHNCDFGFIHEILSISREHEGQVSAGLPQLRAGEIAYLDILVRYGRRYLTEAEFTARRKEIFDDYYEMLASSALRMKGWQFWRYHLPRLQRIGHDLDWSRLIIEATRKVARELRSPAAALRKFNLTFAGGHR